LRRDELQRRLECVGRQFLVVKESLQAGCDQKCRPEE
jgi:hypothetical protein